MLKFKAYIWNSDVYINEKYKFLVIWTMKTI